MISSHMTGFVDFPGRYAMTLFFAGCNMRCPFCFNKEVVNSDGSPLALGEAIKKFNSLRQHMGLGIVYSGGEPTCNPDYTDLRDYFTDLAVPQALHTNGLILDPMPHEFESVVLSLKPSSCHPVDSDTGEVFDYKSAMVDALVHYRCVLHTELRIVKSGKKDVQELQMLLDELPLDGWCVKWVEQEPMMQRSLNHE
jgi:organic radical activating enzyme